MTTVAAGFSTPFIRRPVATTLLALGMLLVGVVAYEFLPVASVPSIDFPVIRVGASRPGAEPPVMAATVAAPLERRLGQIAGVKQLTSTSTLGTTSIVAEFALGRDIDRAGRDVQAAINAAMSDLPGDMPTMPTFRKANPAAMPILILALTSKTVTPSRLFDVADTVLAQRISQIPGVGDVAINGAAQPAIRVRLDPVALAAAGLSTEAVRSAIAAANPLSATGAFQGEQVAESIATNPQITTAAELRTLVVRGRNGAITRLSSVAQVDDATLNNRAFAWFNGEPAVILVITKNNDANVIETVDRIKAMIPEIKRWIPEGVDIAVLSDRTGTIRVSVDDMKLTLVVTIVLVMGVVFAFLRRATPTIAAGVTVPLSLAGTFAGMWLVGFSIDNLSLMALSISVGFVVDDAIVMIENMERNREQGLSPVEAAIAGARQIGFTVLSISLSLIAAFTPLVFMGGVVGRLLREFSLTLIFAILVSTVVSLTVTPMIFGHYTRAPAGTARNRLDAAAEHAFARLTALYRRSLDVALRLPWLTFAIFLSTIGLTIYLFSATPKSYFPQDDSGLIIGSTRAAADISFPAMLALQQKVAQMVLQDEAVAAVGSSMGASAFSATVNRGQMFMSLKPLAERGGATTQEVADRLRRKLSAIPGIRLFLFSAQDVRAGSRQGQSDYDYTLKSADLDLLQVWAPIVLKRLEQLDILTDVSGDRDPGGLQASITIDRDSASRMGVRAQDIDNALQNAFAQRQVSTIYTQRNQYKIVLEVAPQWQRDPNDLSRIYVSGANGAQVPLSAVTRLERKLSPLAVYHDDQMPSTTISFALKPGVELDTATRAIHAAVAELYMPAGVRGSFEGNARDFGATSSAQPYLILLAIVAVYIVLGILYESLAHPFTILSTLPPAGLGALLALQLSGTPLSLIAFVGIILLIGIVKKNGIMVVDFALEGERQRGMSPREAVFEASLARFRPILMTTLAAAFAAVPLLIATGPGSELRRPLGITIIGGLLVSQLLTLYTTPVIYLMIDRLATWRRRSQPRRVLAPSDQATV